MLKQRLIPAICSVLIVVSTASAATFAVRPDRELIQRSDAVVVATALTSYTVLTEAGGIETVTPISIEETIKGAAAGSTVNVVEPGGVYGDRAMLIAGVPRFAEGRRMLLFLMQTGEDRWSVLDLVVGKFTFAEDRLGQKLLVRDEDEIEGVDPNLQPHREMRRSAERFLEFVRSEAHGHAREANYVVPTAELTAPTLAPGPGRPAATATALQPAPLVAPFTATSYTMTISGSLGSRWNVFPNAVSFYMGTTQEPGAPGGGVTAVQAAMSAWDNDCASNVNYVYAGVDDGTHTQGLHGTDGRNTVLYERDLSAWGILPFTCSANGYNGTLGIGGITNAGGSNVVSGETFVTTLEADVEMNKGLANCALLLNSGDFNSAVAHEVGHTLGFRHADQNRPSTGSCSTDASLECASSAIMTAFVTRGINAALQTWDQHAVQAVYPGGTCGGCTLPTVSISASATSITAGTSVNLTSTTTGGVTGYQWYIGATGSTTQPIIGATGPSVTVTPSTTTSYWLRVTNSCGSANSNTITITVTAPPPLPAVPTPSDFNGDKKSDLVFQSSATRGITLWLMNGTQPSAGSQIDIPPAGWVPVTTGDVDGDGLADVVIRNTSTGLVDAYLMSGLTIKSFVGIGGSSLSEVVVGMADFNHDGFDDIVLHNTANGQVAVWYMKGSGILGTKLIGGASAPWSAVAIGDVDGDTWPDIVLQNTSTGQVLIWRTQSGGNIVASGVPGNPGAGVRVIAAGDVNGDGRDDVIFQTPSTGAVSVWIMNGFNVTDSHGVDNPGTSWILKGRGDFNGDGIADLVFQDSSTKTIQVWLMSAGRLASVGQRSIRPEYDLMVNK